MTPLVTTSELATTFASALDEKFSPLAVGTVSALAGRTYDRIIITEELGNRVLLGFVRRSTGELIEPETWARPKSDPEQGLAVRFLLDTPAGLAAAVEAADPEGSFLTEH